MLQFQMSSFSRYSSTFYRRFFQFAFVAWLFFVNFIYYRQFKILFLFRLAAIKHQ